MVLSKRILILEDDLKTLSKILEKLYKLEEDQPFAFSIMILTDYTQVENYINDNPKAEFDIILLDRDCKLGGSFHILDIEKLGTKKVIAISSIPKYNEEAKKRGVKRIIWKDFQNLDQFADNVISEIEKMVKAKTLSRLSKLFN